MSGRRPKPNRRKPQRYPCNRPGCEATTPAWTFFCDDDWNDLPREVKLLFIDKAALRLETGEPNKIAANLIEQAVATFAQGRLGE